MDSPTNPFLYDCTELEKDMHSYIGDVADLEMLSKALQEMKPEMLMGAVISQQIGLFLIVFEQLLRGKRLFIVLVSRNKMVQFIEEKGIQTRMLYAGNIIKHPCFDQMRKEGVGYIFID